MRAYCNADYNSKTWNVLDSHSDHFQSRLQSVHSTHFDSRWRRCLPSSSLTTTLMSLFFSPDWLDLCEGVIFFSSLYPAASQSSLSLILTGGISLAFFFVAAVAVSPFFSFFCKFFCRLVMLWFWCTRWTTSLNDDNEGIVLCFWDLNSYINSLRLWRKKTTNEAKIKSLFLNESSVIKDVCTVFGIMASTRLRELARTAWGSHDAGSRNLALAYIR